MRLIQPLKFRILKIGCFKMPHLQMPHWQIVVFQVVVTIASEPSFNTGKTLVSQRAKTEFFLFLKWKKCCFKTNFDILFQFHLKKGNLSIWEEGMNIYSKSTSLRDSPTCNKYIHFSDKSNVKSSAPYYKDVSVNGKTTLLAYVFGKIGIFQCCFARVKRQ